MTDEDRGTGAPLEQLAMRVPGSASERLRPTAGRRSLALALALAVELLVALLLLFVWPTLTSRPKPPIPKTFGIAAESEADNAAPVKAEAEKAAAGATSKPAPERRPPVVPPPVPKPDQPVAESFVRVTRSDFANGDISRLGTAPGTANADDAAGSGKPDSAEAGRGPHGEPLYAAEWYRRPTRAELNTYLSSRARGPGWGVIACRTVEGYRVEDCQELGEAPLGSGYAGSVRQAAWQFRVRPPRVGGKELVGAWVRIRIDYIEKPE